MAAKNDLRTRAARVSEEMRETGRLVLRAPALVRCAECAMRFLLSAVLAGAELFGGYAPFGLGMVAASGSGLDGFSALLGACFGYLVFLGFAEGLRYAAAAVAGAARLALESGSHPGALKDAVCSPAGSTLQGVRALEDRAFRGAVMEAVIAAAEANSGLGKK